MKGITLIPDASVHEVVTSIPYWLMRDYEEEGQFGLEATPQEFVQTQVDLGKEIWRILRPDGTYFLNVGDSSYGSGKGPTGYNGIGDQEERQGFSDRKAKIPKGMKAKDLVGIPWLLAEALRADGWYWRKYFPWIKRNCLPESIDDRPASSLEIIHMFAKSGEPNYWTHPKHTAVRKRPAPDYIWKNRDTDEVLETEPENWKTIPWAADKRKRLWVRSNLWTGHDYYWDPDAIRVVQPLNTHSRGSGSVKKKGVAGSGIRNNDSFSQSILDTQVEGGRNRRDSDWFMETWQELLMQQVTGWQGLLLDEEGNPTGMIVNPQPFEEKHFATFPENLVKPLLLAGTSEKGCCPKCGAPYIRIIEKGEPLETWKQNCGADSEGEYHGISWKHEKLISGKSGHFHDKEKKLNAGSAHPPGTATNNPHKQDQLGKATYTGFNARWQQNASDVKRRILNGMREREYRWVPSCDCNAGDPVPCTIFDPFLGRGTVTKVARDNGRSSVGCELNGDYIKILKKWLAINQKELETGISVATYSFEEAP